MTAPAELTGRDADDVRWMRVALEHARAAHARGEVPVGAVLVCDGAVVSEGANANIREGDATVHAEMVALRGAHARTGERILAGTTLYVTLEPCAMCAGAIVLARVDRVVFGAWDEKAGMAGSVEDLLRHPKLNHRPEVKGGVLAEECSTVLSSFFKDRRTSREMPSIKD
jgi:tRNA(adenine34) deaminase